MSGSTHIPSYACARRCPILTCHPTCYALSGTDMRYAAARREPSKIWRPEIHPLRPLQVLSYALSGTDIAYGAIQCPHMALWVPCTKSGSNLRYGPNRAHRPMDSVRDVQYWHGVLAHRPMVQIRDVR
eukprot:3941628-Rhodomonas_salina.2